jgi:AraC family transcriptional regulator, exoenzyme S synthesis regulatory protein ExsA
MKTVFEHTRANILVIPQALFAMKDVNVLMRHGEAAIFHKNLERDLVDVEFYTNKPCLIYIESGHEVLTDSDNNITELHPESAIFLPQGLNLHSDYVKRTESLKAYLVFFDEQVTSKYLRKKKMNGSLKKNECRCCLLEDKEGDLANFFGSIRSDIKEPDYMDIKLQELLHLIACIGDSDIFHGLLSRNIASNKRNLHRLLETHDILHLTVSDMAYLSGRSLSSFNRDFKQIYSIPPQKWLRDKRLSRAKWLLENRDISVTETALEVGYENVSNFIRVFKLKYGKTPKHIKMNR